MKNILPHALAMGFAAANPVEAGTGGPQMSPNDRPGSYVETHKDFVPACFVQAFDQASAEIVYMTEYGDGSNGLLGTLPGGVSFRIDVAPDDNVTGIQIHENQPVQDGDARTVNRVGADIENFCKPAMFVS